MFKRYLLKAKSPSWNEGLALMERDFFETNPVQQSFPAKKLILRCQIFNLAVEFAGLVLSRPRLLERSVRGGKNAV